MAKLPLRYDKGPGHVRLGKLLASWNLQMYGSEPILDGCWTTLTRHDGGSREAERFGGLAIRLPWRRKEGRGYSICWAGDHCPNPARWRPRYLLARLRWRLAGQPQLFAAADDGVNGEPVLCQGGPR